MTRQKWECAQIISKTPATEHKMLNQVDLEKPKPVPTSPLKNSFAEAKLKMVMITDNIWKKVIKSGNLEKGRVPEKAKVTIRYKAYWDKSLLPFSFTKVPDVDFEFSTASSAVTAGIINAVRTMCEGEQAWFIISNQVLHGEEGYPPRVPPKSDGFFKIEVKNFEAIREIDTYDIPSEKRYPFEFAVQVAMGYVDAGLECFNKKSYIEAYHLFDVAVTKLMQCNLQTHKEQKVWKSLQLILQTNMAICSNFLFKSNLACIHINEVRRLSDGKTLSHKLLYHEGLALLAFGKYRPARDALKEALNLSPQNATITQLLKKVDVQLKVYMKSQYNIRIKTFEVQKSTEVDQVKDAINEEPKTAAEIEAEENEFNALNKLETFEEDYQKFPNVAFKLEPSDPNTKVEDDLKDCLEKLNKLHDEYMMIKGPEKPKNIEEDEKSQSLAEMADDFAKRLDELTFDCFSTNS